MISSIFGKTKPINFIIIFIYLFVFYWLAHFFLFKRNYQTEEILVQVGVLAILLFSIFIVDFIVKRNKITGVNSFAILFFGLLITLFPEVLIDKNAILCCFFLLLSARRLLSLRSLRNSKLKIFDATLWVVVASFFYEWALLYLLLVFLAIYFYEPKNVKNWLVPFIGMFTPLTIMVCILICINKLDFLQEHYTFSYVGEPTFFEDWANSLRLIVYIMTAVFTGVLAFLKLGKTGLGRIITMRLIALFYLIGMLFTILQSSPGYFPLIITFFPVAIFFANYVDTIKRANIKEIVLIISVFVPLMVFFTSLILK